MPEEVFDNPRGWVADHVRRYVESGGRRGHRFNGRDALLLTTRGRRSGRLRRTALYYGRDGDRYVVVATEDPAWYRNLLANPAGLRGRAAAPVGAHAGRLPEVRGLRV